MITHGCKNFEEKKKNVTGRENQEICGGVLADLFEKARHTANTGKISMTFRGIYDSKQGQGVFNPEEVGCRGIDSGKQKERTVRQRKYDIDHLFVSPYLESTEVVLIEREVGNYHCFRYLGCLRSLLQRDGRETIPGCTP